MSCIGCRYRSWLSLWCSIKSHISIHNTFSFIMNNSSDYATRILQATLFSMHSLEGSWEARCNKAHSHFPVWFSRTTRDRNLPLLVVCLERSNKYRGVFGPGGMSLFNLLALSFQPWGPRCTPRDANNEFLKWECRIFTFWWT